MYREGLKYKCYITGRGGRYFLPVVNLYLLNTSVTSHIIEIRITDLRMAGGDEHKAEHIDNNTSDQ